MEKNMPEVQRDRLFAYADWKCCYGYMLVCSTCLPDVPCWVDTSKAIPKPPCLGSEQACELCKRELKLEGA